MDDEARILAEAFLKFLRIRNNPDPFNRLFDSLIKFESVDIVRFDSLKCFLVASKLNFDHNCTMAAARPGGADMIPPAVRQASRS